MPTIQILLDDLQNLVGRPLPQDKMELTEILAYVKGEAESIEGNNLTVELKDGNRPDLWSVEGIARGLRGALGLEMGLKRYKVADSSGVDIFVDPHLKEIRPYIACAVVRGVHLDDEIIRELMHLQDKLDQTYGRKRRRASIGFYNFGLIFPPIHYKTATPKEYGFVPLDGSEKMTLKEILERHPKGIEYGQILENQPLWPILVDDAGNVLSFPPIINSNDLGKIVGGNQDIFVEVTGTDYQVVLNTVTLLTIGLADRGQQILSVKISYPYRDLGDDTTPNLSTRTINFESKDVNRTLGICLEPNFVAKLLERARYGTVVRGGEIKVTVPCYRTDIMHPLDIIEDVAIAYGFNNIAPVWPKLATTGGIAIVERFTDMVRELMIGLGFQEILTFSLSTPENQRDKMRLRSTKLVEIANPMTLRFTCLRNWLIPSLMEFLVNNAHAAFPQKVFEVGDCVVVKENLGKQAVDIRKLAVLITHPQANFSELKGNMEALFDNLRVSLELVETEHSSFIPGRCCLINVERVELGLLGELHPQVLENWGLINPVAAFEINLTELFEYSSSNL